MITDKNISRKLRNNNIKDFNTPEEFNEFLSNAYLELGDVRSLQILNPLTGSEWYDSNNIPETITEFCRDPNYLHFVAKHILNVELLPYQCVILQTLWNKTFPFIVASRGAAKSFILTVYLALRALLHQGANVVIVGAALRQSMVLFHYLEKIWENAPVLRDIVGPRNHPKRDLHMAFWNCGISKALFLPIGSGDKIRGQRATHIISDECASLPPEIFETVVRGFASVRSEGLVDNVIHAHKLKLAGEMGINFNADEVTTEVGIPTILKNNQIVMAGTANFQFNHMYRYYQHYTAIIRSGGNRKILKQMFPEMDISEDIDPSQYAVIQLPYDKLPPGMMDNKILEQGKATMDRQIFVMEYGSIFPADSEGFYLASVIQKATCPLTINDKQYNFNALLSGDRKNSYVMGIDPASESDNFAICIEELDQSIGRVVYQWTTNRKKFEKDKLDGKVTVGIEDYNTYCIRHIRMLLRRFNIILICLDAAGGGLWVKEGLRDPGKMVAGDQIIQDMDEEGPAIGEKILKMIQFSDTTWRKEAHWGLKKDLMDHLVLFPYFDAAEIELDNVARSSNNPYPETMEDTYDEILQLKTEMTFIKYSQTTNATETWDIPKLKGINAEAIKKTLKKDRFTSLLLANWARRLTIDSQGGPTHYIKECYGGVSRELVDNNPGAYQGISIRNHGGGNRRICY